MREIKFKVWDKIHEEWVELGEDYFISYAGEKLEVIQGNECWTEVLKDVDIVQYTGLKDVTGKEIYEGDIIPYHLDKSKVGVVTYGQNLGHIGFYVDWKTGIHRDILLKTLAYWASNSTVVGNIYENSELLERKNNAQ